MQWVLAQATQVENDYHLQWAPIPMAPGNVGINVPTYRGTATLKGAGDMAQAVECHFPGIKPWVQIKHSQWQKKYLGLRKYLNGKMSAQHEQSPGFNSPTLLNQKKKKSKKDNWH
jgi:hypothetical protein